MSPSDQESMVSENVGRVVQIIGPVVDVEFEKGVPPIYNAVRITSEGEEGGVKLDVITEVEQHLGENRVRQAKITKEIIEIVSGAAAS